VDARGILMDILARCRIRDGNDVFSHRRTGRLFLGERLWLLIGKAGNQRTFYKLSEPN